MPRPVRLRFSAVRRRARGGIAALAGLELEVQEGEHLVLLGAPGSGARTALLLAAGTIRPDGGEILLAGARLHRRLAHRRGLGVVAPWQGLFPHLSVAGNVDYPLARRGVARAERPGRVDGTLAMLGLTDLADRYPDALSAGQTRMAMLARAVAAGPAALLLHEPTEGLAAEDQAAFVALLRRIRRQLGLTVLQATADPLLALALADRLGVMHGGRLLQLGAPEAVYEDPAGIAAACLTGAANRLPGTVLDVEDGIARVALACGPVVAAAVPDDAPVGPSCVVFIRPERVAVAAVPAAEMGEGALDARVAEIVWLGDRVRLRFAIGDGGEVLVTRPAAAGLAGLAPGRAAALAWQPQHARAFPREN